MKNKGLLSLICLGVVLSLALPTEVLANTTEAYGAKDIVDIGSKLKDFLFKVVVPFAAGIFGAIYTIQSFMANNYSAMGCYALLTAASFVIPPFLTGVFGASMLLP